MSSDRIEALRARVVKLGPEQREKLRVQIEAAGIPWERIAPEDPAEHPRPERLPLTPAQMQFWLMQQLAPNSAASTIAFSWAITGPLNQDALSRAVSFVAARHEPLRACFPSQEGTPWQAVSDQPVVLEQSTSNPKDVADVERAFAAEPFDLSTGPLFRAHLVRLAEQQHTLMLSLHHIVADGWSRGVLIRELTAAYREFCAGRTPALAPLKRGFADHVLEQQRWLKRDDAKGQTVFWKERLAGLAVQSLPTKSGATTRDQKGETLQLDFDGEMAMRVREGAAGLGVTPFMFYLAVFKLLLHRYTGETDLAVGTPTAGRRDPEMAGVVGLFLNTLVLRSKLDPQMTFAAWLTHVQQGFAQSFEHQDLPFANVIDAVGAERRAGQTPLFQTLFQVQTNSYRQQNAAEIDLGDDNLQVRQSVIPLPEAKFDLSWHMMEREAGLSVIVEYRSGLFDAAFTRRMADHFQTLVAAALACPDGPVTALDYLEPSEVADLGQRGPQWDIAPLVPDALGRIAVKTPGAEALIFDGTALSYAALDRRVTELAQRLRAHPAVSKGSRVVVALERGTDLVLVLLAALRAGVTYVPLDPAQPHARKVHIVADAQADLVISEAPIAGFDGPQLSVAELEALNPVELSPVSPDALAYVIYTSGSTGRPKGVPITHRALSNLIGAMIRQPGLIAADRWLATTTVGFDIAGLELFGPLCAGATLVLADRETVLSPPDLINLIDGQRVTHMQATPALWRALVDSGWSGKSDLTVLCGGEALDTALARSLLSRGAALWNMYGPTETTIWSAALQVQDTHLTGSVVPIGGAIANTELTVLDTHGQPVPCGIPGELAIGGVGLSPGYWNRSDLTAQVFRDGRYRTGDMVVEEADGTFRFLGRTDHQIKLNGYRVEPGEIQTALMERGLAEALVILDPARPRLIAYCRAQGEPPDVVHLKRELADVLPPYMVPAIIVFVDKLELNANGKVDRAKLPIPEVDDRRASRAPATEVEHKLYAIWCAVLDRKEIGVEDNFFDLGGASVTAMQIVARARDVGLVLHPQQLFDHQTIAEQAQIATALPQTRSLPFTPWQAHIRDKGLAPWLVTLPVPPGSAAQFPAAIDAAADDHDSLLLRLAEGWEAHEPNATAMHASVDLGAWARAEVSERHPWRACITSDNRLALAAHPMLLDVASLERLARRLCDRLNTEYQGHPGKSDRGASFWKWLDTAHQSPPVEATELPRNTPPQPEPAHPVRLEVSGAELMHIRSTAEILNVTPEDLTTATLGQTLALWVNAQSLGIDLLTSTPPQTGLGRSLGNFTRLLPLTVPRARGDGAGQIASITRAIRAGDTMGIAPRDSDGAGVLLSWHSFMAEGIEWLSRPTSPNLPGYAMVVEAEMSSQALSLIWRFDPTHLSHSTVMTLAKRHLSALTGTLPARTTNTERTRPGSNRPSDRLNQLRAQIRRPER